MTDKTVFSYDADGNPAGAIDIGLILAIPDRIIKELFASDDWDDRWDVADAVMKTIPDPDQDPDLAVSSLTSVIATFMQFMNSMSYVIDEATGKNTKAKLRELYEGGGVS